MGLLMVGVIRIERIYINDLTLCLTHSRCFQIVVMAISIAVNSSIIRSSLEPQRGQAASPFRLWLGQSSQSPSNTPNLPFLRQPPKGHLSSLWPGQMTASGQVAHNLLFIFKIQECAQQTKQSRSP